MAKPDEGGNGGKPFAELQAEYEADRDELAAEVMEDAGSSPEEAQRAADHVMRVRRQEKARKEKARKKKTQKKPKVGKRAE